MKNSIFYNLILGIISGFPFRKVRNISFALYQYLLNLYSIKIFFYMCFLLLFTFFLYSCDYTKSNATSIYFSTASISNNLVTRSLSTLEISWSLLINHVYKYELKIYLSKDDVLDKDDEVLYESVFSDSQGVLTFYSGDYLIDRLLSVYPNRYFLILKAIALSPSGEELYDENHRLIYDEYYLPLTVVSPKKKWTIMIYMDGDNSLSSETTYDLGEIEQIGSSDQVNIVVLCDWKWSSARLYYVLPDDFIELQNLGEIDMSDPRNLVDFARFVFDTYPAEHYFLILWDHGWGFKPARRDLLEDDNPELSWMDIPTLGRALQSVRDILGRPLDMVGFDACLMDMLEVAYQLRSAAFLMIASENYEWGPGWNYFHVLSPIVCDPDMSPYVFAQKVVEAFAQEYQGEEDATLAAIELTKIAAIREALDNLVSSLDLNNNPDRIDLLTGTIFDQVQRFDDGEGWGMSPDDDSYVDLYHLMQLIGQNIPDVQTEASAVASAISNAVLANWYSSPSVSQAHGLSIWFPNPFIYVPEEWQFYWDHYKDLSFANDSLWPEFLLNLWGLSAY